MPKETVIEYNTPEEIEALADKLVQVSASKHMSVVQMIQGLQMTAFFWSRDDASIALDKAIAVLIQRGVLKRGKKQ